MINLFLTNREQGPQHWGILGRGPGSTTEDRYCPVSLKRARLVTSFYIALVLHLLEKTKPIQLMTVSAETVCKEGLNGGTSITLKTYIFGSVTQGSEILGNLTLTGKIPTKKESIRTAPAQIFLKSACLAI